MSLYDVLTTVLDSVLAGTSAVMNLVLILATVSSKKLRSSCNLLIAIDAAFVEVMQLERVIRLVIALCWQTVSMPACIVALAVPTICMESSAMLQVVIALDRFFHVFFPFWSMKVDRTKVYLTLMICLGLSRGFIDFTPIAIEVFQQQQDGNRTTTCSYTDLYLTQAGSRLQYSGYAVMAACVLLYTAIWLRILKMSKTLAESGPTSTEETNRRLFKSLLINIFLVTLAWATPPISASLLEAAGPNVPWAIYGPIAGGAIEISTIVMCPVLYVVCSEYRLAINELFHQHIFPQNAENIGQKSQQKMFTQRKRIITGAASNPLPSKL